MTTTSRRPGGLEIGQMKRADAWFCDLMRHASEAGRFRYWARKEPLAAPGLTRLADKESALARAALAEWLTTTQPNFG